MKADEWIRISLTELMSLMICTLKTLKPRRLLWHISKLINLKSESEFENLINPKENDVCFTYSKLKKERHRQTQFKHSPV